MTNALLDKKSFVGLDKYTWLFSGAETPPHARCIEAVNEYMLNRGKGPEGRELHTLQEQSLRRNLAKLLNGREQDIGLLSNASECITAVVHALELKKGDNVVINTLEYPSGVMPLLQLQQNGVDVRIVDHENWDVSPDAMMELVDSNTRLVMASHVSYLSGARFDYKALYEKLKKTDTLFLLDITQSLGAVSVDMNHADFVVCSSYKWLLAVHGLGILGINPARTEQLVPHSVGWRSVKEIFHERRFQDYAFLEDARKFELGYPSYPSIYAMNCSTGLLLETGIDRIEKHILELGGVLIRELAGRGYQVMTPEAPEKRAGNIAISFERGGELADALRQQGVLVWGGDGRFRASIHGYNDSADIDRLLETLSDHAGSFR